MSLSTQYAQTGIHRCLALLSLTIEMSQQDIGRVIDIEHDTLRAVAADLNNDWPFKSARAGHHSPSKPSGDSRAHTFPQPNDSAAFRLLDLIASTQAVLMNAVWLMSGGVGFG